MHEAPQLASLQDHTLGPYALHIHYQPRRRVGHFDLNLFLTNNKGQRTCEPLITGIYSTGNPNSRIFSWLDIHYLDWFTFDNGDDGVLSEIEDLSGALFRMIGGFIPPGGMIICSYISDVAWGIKSPIHEITRQCLGLNSLKIPPAATPIGRLLVAAGCCNIKAGAYDVQGSSRLAGEKALDGEYEKHFTQRLIEQLEEYLRREPNSEYQDIENSCRTNAEVILDQLIMK